MAETGNALNDPQSNRVKDFVQRAAERTRQTWQNMTEGQQLTAKGTAGLATVAMAVGGIASIPNHPDVSPNAIAGKEFKLDQSNSMLVEENGKPSVLNYFPGQGANTELLSLQISLATRVPDHFRDGRVEGEYLDNVENHAQSHTYHTEYVPVQSCTSDGNGGQSCTTTMQPVTVTDYHSYSYDLDIENDFRPVNAAQEKAVYKFAEEFERITGIPVVVTKDNPDADITIANYSNAPDHYQGSLDWVSPGDIASNPPGAIDAKALTTGQGFVILNDRNGGDENSVLSSIGKAIGFADGKINYTVLRRELANAGIDTPGINEDNTTYELSGDNLNPNNAQLEDRTIYDSAGLNTLVGTPNDDILLSEAGTCGKTNVPSHLFSSMFEDGKKYCLAEGEFSMIQAENGNDVIITARDAAQLIEPGKGEDKVQVYTPDVGDITVLSLPANEQGEDTLVLSDEILRRANVNVTQYDVDAAESVRDHPDIILNFSAQSGREMGKITLLDQQENNGVSKLRIVNNEGDTVWEKDVGGINTVAQWQSDVIDPMMEAMAKRHNEVPTQTASVDNPSGTKSWTVRATQQPAEKGGGWSIG